MLTRSKTNQLLDANWNNFQYRMSFGAKYKPYREEILFIFGGKPFNINNCTNGFLLRACGIYYNSVRQFDKELECLVKSIECGNPDAIHAVVKHYECLENNYEIERILHMGVYLGDAWSLNDLSRHYLNKYGSDGNPDHYIIVQLLNICIDIDKSNGKVDGVPYFNLGEYYRTIGGDIELAKKNYWKAILHMTDDYSVTALQSITQPCELYLLLSNLKGHNNSGVDRELANLKKRRDVQCLINKIRLFSELNVIKECGICFETKLNINLNCSHLVCVDCYWKLNKCHLCRDVAELCDGNERAEIEI